MVKPGNVIKKSGKEFFYVEKILEHRVENGKKKYLVKWSGFDETENSWEPAESFLNSEVVKNYEERLLEQKKENKMAKSDLNQRRLAPISTEFSTGFRTSSRQRKPTYKRSLIEKLPEDIEPINPRTASFRSTSEDANSIDLNKDEFIMPIKKKHRGGGRPRKHPIVQESNKILKNIEPEEFRIPEETIELLNEHEKERSEDGKFDLHPYNGLIGEEVNSNRISKLVEEMDEALDKTEGFLIADESNKYRLTRLILIAKRPNGMIGYIRIEHKFEKFVRFECVPLEILIGIHPYVVLNYMQEQMKLKLLEERRHKITMEKKQNGINSNGTLSSASTSGN